MRDFLDPYGFKMPEIVGTAAGFSAQYQAVYDSFAVKPAADIATQQDTMVRALVSAGIWAALDVFYIFANNTRANAVINWVNPGTFDAIEVNAPTFLAYRHFVGNGINQCLRTQYTPNIHAVNLTQNNASACVYIRNNYLPGGNHFVMGGSGAGWAGGIQIVNRFSDGNAYVGRINTTTLSAGVVNADGSGFYVANRLAVNDQDLYKNSVRIIDDNDASTGLSPNEIYILCANFNGIPQFFTLWEVASSSMGAGLDESSSEITNYTNAIETYMDYVGAGVI